MRHKLQTVVVSRDSNRLRTSGATMLCGKELAVIACMGTEILLLCYTLVRCDQFFLTQQKPNDVMFTEILHDLTVSTVTTLSN